MLLRACLLAMLVALCAGLAAGETIEASAVAQSLLTDLALARNLLQANQSPWQEPAARPQPEPLALLREDLPGDRIWLAFKPVDRLVREAYWLQRMKPLEKDAAIRPCREARELLPGLAEIIRSERACYNRTVTNLAVRQVAEVDNALKHMEYHAALCVLWSMADLLGLWDRQAALEIAEDHLRDLRDTAAGKTDLGEKVARRMDAKLATIAQIIEAAVAWKPIPEGIGPAETGPACAEGAGPGHHFADAADLGPAFDPWRQNSVVDASATPLLFDETNVRYALSFPAREVRCLYVCPEYRPWQATLHDRRYGWSPYKNSAAQQKPGCDWRKLEPWATWPGAKGANNAGGL